MRAFSRYPARLQEAIVSRLGWSSLRPVQELASHALLDGKNAVVLAPTAGGKTEAAVFPMIAGLMEREPEGVGLIYIAPLKALLNNQADRLGVYASMVGLKRFVWHGDVAQSRKRAFLKEPADLLMTTPESLEVMLLSPRAPHASLFRDLGGVIIDEIHALAGTDRGAHLMAVLERLVPYAQRDVQRVGLSATVGNPRRILAWLQGSSRREGAVIDPPAAPTKKEIRVFHRDTVLAIARDASRRAQGGKSLFFCQSRAMAESIADRARGRGAEVFVHHGSVSREERQAAEERFHHGENASIVCTSTLELGVDVGDLDFVFQINAPSTVSSFLQRLGRTGRRPGQRANTTFFCENVEVVLQAVAIIELAREKWVESTPRNNRCWPVLVHQLLALALQFGAVAREACREALAFSPDFAGISRAEFDHLVDHLVQKDFLYLSDGLLSIGDETERVFGRKNFMELYAVFSSPQLYKVKTGAGHALGSLEQAFVDTLVEEMSSFLLSGRAWTVTRINHVRRTVRVVPAPRGRKPGWGGFAPQILGFELCQKVEALLKTDVEIPYIDASSSRARAEMREDLAPLLNRSGRAIQMEPGRALWWTFAGGRINHTFKYGVQLLSDWKATADNFRVKIEGDGLTFERLERLIGVMADPAFWKDPATRDAIMGALPEYRLSRFQRALPRAFSAEMVCDFLLDIEGAGKRLMEGR